MNPDQENQNAPLPGSSRIDPQPPEGQNPAPMVGGPQKGKNMAWLWIIIILILLLALFFGWWWWKDKDKKNSAVQNNSNNNSSQQQKQEACDRGFTEYENTELKVGFCYPTDWGEVAVADARLQKTPIVVDGETIAADTGQRWLISFSEKSAVNLGLVSADWSTEVGRGGSCVDPATPTLPEFSPFSTEWEVEPVIATRGIEVIADKYLIEESADEFYNGVCISGYTIINAEDFTHSVATYYAEFGGAVMTPEQHVDNPNVLAPEVDRSDFYTFVKSVHAL